MKSAVLHAVNTPLQIQDVKVDAPGPREVLVHTAAAGVCHSDLHFVEGAYRTRLPAAMGHESAGVVEAVGEDVTYVKPGDPVITCMSAFCGQCSNCIAGRPFLCAGRGLSRGRDEAPRLSADGSTVHQFANLGSFAEEMLVHENTLVKIGRDMPLDRAALLGCAVTTGVGSVFNTAAIPAGSTVAVLGCGGIGLNAIQGARIAGASTIVAVDAVAAKLDLARRFGATHTVDATGGDPVELVQEAVRGGAEYTFEAIGLKQTIEQAYAMTQRGGTLTVIGMMPEGTTFEVPGSDLVFGSKRILGSNMGSNRFRLDLPRYVDLYLDGRLLLDELVSARIELGAVNDAFAAMKTGEVARSVIVF
jgi:S-(hydroxymethyl)glutathione dehydrogenase/alcohol dehydrogenase